jgi:hypothetical protein
MAGVLAAKFHEEPSVRWRLLFGFVVLGVVHAVQADEPAPDLLRGEAATADVTVPNAASTHSARIE